MPVTTCVFDAYGTLFDVTAAARACAAEPGREALAAVAPRLAETWRLKQLQYSWLRAVTGAHADFWQVTGEALDYAMEEAGLGPDPGLAARLMDLYRELEAYPEVPDMLAGLKARGLSTAILSNGAPAMLADAVASAGIGADLDAVLSVEDAGVFKPARAVYDLVGRCFGCPPWDVLFVSSNGWDAAAAAGYGFRTLWVNRSGLPVDRLPWRPDSIAPDLTTVAGIATGS
ncbi:haloacid dehalogenase type II [Paroceanicella profunda]|uniref:(S)-2-haloacid dehalogenase n=1 Tax=Paroceanicella profunda TaxID=2579971 RepID=A0A5B8FY99_9RHOB|nr:haloacid dehalogenase type II [Paroceanicella profunda]QDL91599.1 haloacid dehalogenase type II [Paroceanicella profunda]